MTEKWEGFTAEEISRITNQNYSISKDPSLSSLPVKKMTFKQNKFSKKNMTRERMLKTPMKLSVGENQAGLPLGARLFIPQIPEEDEIEDLIVPCGDTPVSTTLSPPVPPEVSTETAVDLDSRRHPASQVVLLSAPNETMLDEFEKRQKMIKEQNRQRKELLKKALEDRTKKTHEEARRLSQIEEELKKLDIQLSNDVSILRNQIEEASLEFMEAQKRFDRAEREYLDAKLTLFTKQERKELLTGHLCTIIEQNELRKAKKLSDLMEKLQLSSVIIEKPMEIPQDPVNSVSKDHKDNNVVPKEAQSPT